MTVIAFLPRRAALAPLLIAGALLAGCATRDADWPTETVKLEQLQPTQPIQLSMQWWKADGRPGGTVSLRALLRVDGSIDTVQILDSSGRKEFDQAAVFALKTARFAPYQLGGSPAAVTVMARFSLPESRKPEILRP